MSYRVLRFNVKAYRRKLERVSVTTMQAMARGRAVFKRRREEASSRGGVVRLKIIEAHGLAPPSTRKKWPDAYAVVRVWANGKREELICEAKTPVLYQDACPAWDFDLRLSSMTSKSVIQVAVYDHERWRDGPSLGEATLKVGLNVRSDKPKILELPLGRSMFIKDIEKQAKEAKLKQYKTLNKIPDPQGSITLAVQRHRNSVPSKWKVSGRGERPTSQPLTPLCQSLVKTLLSKLGKLTPPISVLVF